MIVQERTEVKRMPCTEYSKHEVHAERNKIVSALLSVFGIFIIASALAIFPRDSSW